uniref:SAGA-associated factor 11 n=1 Tax=Steinernema glaseri TaxID=37863 RepID=A0A1I7ZBD7_9BILA
MAPEPDEPEIDLEEMKRRRKEDIPADDAVELLYNDVLMAFVTQVAFVHHRASTIGIDLRMLASTSNGTSSVPSSQPSTSNGKSSSNGARSKHECKCPECGRTIAATRFAPHLENCLGMGRTAARASRRRPAGFYAAGNNFGSKSDTNLVAKDLKGSGATHSATNSIIDSDHDGADPVEDDDDDWKGKKTRKRKPAAKRGGKGGKRKR